MAERERGGRQGAPRRAPNEYAAHSDDCDPSASKQMRVACAPQHQAYTCATAQATRVRSFAGQDRCRSEALAAGETTTPKRCPRVMKRKIHCNTRSSGNWFCCPNWRARTKGGRGRRRIGPPKFRARHARPLRLAQITAGSPGMMRCSSRVCFSLRYTGLSE